LNFRSYNNTTRKGIAWRDYEILLLWNSKGTDRKKQADTISDGNVIFSGTGGGGRYGV
jgi:hypothetical protein